MKRDIRSLLLWLRGLPVQLFSAFRSVRTGQTPVSFHSRAFRIITWVSIVCQLGFPLALAFTPSVLAAGQKDLSTEMQALQQGLGTGCVYPYRTAPVSPVAAFYALPPGGAAWRLPHKCSTRTCMYPSPAVVFRL